MRVPKDIVRAWEIKSSYEEYMTNVEHNPVSEELYKELCKAFTELSEKLSIDYPSHDSHEYNQPRASLIDTSSN